MKKRSGFSLISVLIISMVAVALMAGIVYMFSTSAATARVSISQADAHNIMQGGVEQARAWLRERMKKSRTDVPLRWSYSDPRPIIDELSDLLIRDPNTDSVAGFGVVIPSTSSGGTAAADYERVTVGGRTYRYTVRIYDMQYKLSDVSTALPEAQLNALYAELPQTYEFSAVETDDFDPNTWAPHEGERAAINAGIYLIRATLEPEQGGAVRMIETAVIQTLEE